MSRVFRILFIVLISFTLVKCASVETFNKKLIQPIPQEKLIKDVDYVQHKLKKLYPNLYGYIPQEKLNYKFDSIRSTINKPMTSKEFFFTLSPVVAAVKQGHMTLSVPLKKFTKEQLKRFKKAGAGPLSQFEFEWQNNKLYVVKNKSLNKTIQAGAEVVSINNVIPQDIYKKYSKTYTSDGFNQTFMPKFFIKRFPNYMTSEIGTNDSLTYVFRQNDSLNTQVISRIKKEKKSETKTAVVKTEVDKAKIKAERKLKKIYGYDDTTKEYSKSLKFIQSDSSVAVLKIRNFTEGRFGKAYDEIFKKIKEHNAKTLIIDLRNNPGGRVSEIVNLYSYLTDKDFVMLKNAQVTSKTSLWKLGVFSHVPKVSYPFIAAFYPFYMGFSYIKTKKNADGSYYYSLTGSKSRVANSNHFSGKIYVLINGGSFSASCLLSSTLKANKNVTFVGEETGGAFNGTVAGIMPVVNLPNSKLALRLGLMDIKPINQTEVFGRGVFPDIEITPTIQDRIAGKDPEMDWILNDVKSNSVK